MDQPPPPTPDAVERRITDTEFLEFLRQLAQAFQSEKNAQAVAEDRAFQLQRMAEQNRHNEATRWMAAVDDQRRQHYDFLRHQFDRLFWLTVGVAIVALAVMAGLIFLKDDLKSAYILLSLCLSFLAGRRSKDWFALPQFTPSRSTSESGEPKDPH